MNYIQAVSEYNEGHLVSNKDWGKYDVLRMSESGLVRFNKYTGHDSEISIEDVLSNNWKYYNDIKYFNFMKAVEYMNDGICVYFNSDEYNIPSKGSCIRRTGLNNATFTYDMIHSDKWYIKRKYDD